MAWSASGQSGFFINTMIAALTGVSQTGGSLSPLNINSSANQKLSLVSGSATNYSAAPLQYGSAAPAWVNTFEVTGTGWATGGVLLSTATAASGDVVPTTTITGSGPYVLTYTWTTALSVPSTTLTGIYGCIIYYPNPTAPVAKPELLALYFGSTAYNTVAGTFGITPSGSGLAALTLTA
jgi:hypothetical protein